MKPDEAIHGKCKGSDEKFHDLMRIVMPTVGITGFPSTLTSTIAKVICDRDEDPQDPLVRNDMMADACTYMVATPAQAKEAVRPGTWATVRYALKYGKPVLVIEPDGTLTPRGDGAYEFFGVARP
jgi:hypothetical protein